MNPIEALPNHEGWRRKRDGGRIITPYLGLVVSGVLMALAIVEVFLRLSGLGHAGLYQFDPDAGWSLRPNASLWQRQEGGGFVRVSSYGLRGPERPYRKPANTYRIAILGDSFTE